MPFVKGQSGNPTGRPSKARQDLDKLLGEVFTQTKRKAVLQRLIDDAIAGQHDARTLLLAYTYGKPVERTEHTGADGAALRIQVVYDDSDADTRTP